MPPTYSSPLCTPKKRCTSPGTRFPTNPFTATNPLQPAHYLLGSQAGVRYVFEWASFPCSTCASRSEMLTDFGRFLMMTTCDEAHIVVKMASALNPERTGRRLH